MNLKHIAKDMWEAEDLARKNPEQSIHFPGGEMIFTAKLPKAKHPFGAFITRSVA